MLLPLINENEAQKKRIIKYLTKGISSNFIFRMKIVLSNQHVYCVENKNDKPQREHKVVKIKSYLQDLAKGTKTFFLFKIEIKLMYIKSLFDATVGTV